MRSRRDGGTCDAGVIGYYVHHHGSGHRHRAVAIARALTERGEQVTGLSSLAEPEGWPGEWLRLEPDADLDAHGSGSGTLETQDPTAGGLLHWAPPGHPGLRSRMAAVAGWLESARPASVVVDVSVEVALLVRLHGVSVVTVVQPGRRTDPAHLLGYGVSDALVACWPDGASGPTRELLPGLPEHLLARVLAVGAVSRTSAASSSRHPAGCRVVLLSGTGGAGVDRVELAAARAATPGWEWTVLDRDLGTWVDDPAPLLAAADVVVTHAGQNALAEVAAARTPAVVVPQQRPHDEQSVTGAALAAGPWPVVVGPWPRPGGWADLLARVARLDGAAWAGWYDGHGADRFADVVRRVAGMVPR